MEASTKKKWVPMTVVFLSVFGSFALLMYLSITTFSTARGRSSYPFIRYMEKPTQWNDFQKDSKATAKPAPATVGWQRIVLLRDREVRVGRAMLTYRGLGEGATIRIDAVIPDLDSQYIYRQQFERAAASKGFNVGGERLMLISAGRYRLRLSHFITNR